MPQEHTVVVHADGVSQAQNGLFGRWRMQRLATGTAMSFFITGREVVRLSGPGGVEELWRLSQWPWGHVL